MFILLSLALCIRSDLSTALPAIAIMPQFDVLLFAKIMNVLTAVVITAAFFLIFFSVLLNSLTQMVSLAFSAETLNRLRLIRAAATQSLLVICFRSDLLEQFVFTPTMHTFYVLFCPALLLGTTLVYLPGVANLMRVFVGDLTHSINADSRADSARMTPFYLSLFVTILTSNIVGLIPGAFTISGAIVVPFAFVITVGFYWVFTLYSNNKIGALSGLMPSGVNPFIVPLIIIIETISSIAKFFSLGVRLFANMFAGHLLLKVLYSACFILISNASLFLMLANAAVGGFTAFIFILEVLIAFLQAFVFVLLTMIYFKEARLFVSASH